MPKETEYVPASIAVKERLTRVATERTVGAKLLVDRAVTEFLDRLEGTDPLAPRAAGEDVIGAGDDLGTGAATGS